MITVTEPTVSTSAETGLPVITFAMPMPGIPDLRNFVLVQLDECALLFSLTSIDTPQLRFVVVPPAPFFPDYAPEIDIDSLSALGTPRDKMDRLLVLLVISAGGPSPSDATANLLAPIVVDPDTRRAVQLVLTGSDLPVRAPLMKR
jgi:flagellar assembly factor FliW